MGWPSDLEPPRRQDVYGAAGLRQVVTALYRSERATTPERMLDGADGLLRDIEPTMAELEPKKFERRRTAVFKTLCEDRTLSKNTAALTTRVLDLPKHRERRGAIGRLLHEAPAPHPHEAEAARTRRWLEETGLSDRTVLAMLRLEGIDIPDDGKFGQCYATVNPSPTDLRLRKLIGTTPSGFAFVQGKIMVPLKAADGSAVQLRARRGALRPGAGMVPPVHAEAAATVPGFDPTLPPGAIEIPGSPSYLGSVPALDATPPSRKPHVPAIGRDGFIALVDECFPSRLTDQRARAYEQAQKLLVCDDPEWNAPDRKRKFQSRCQALADILCRAPHAPLTRLVAALVNRLLDAGKLGGRTDTTVLIAPALTRQRKSAPGRPPPVPEAAAFKAWADRTGYSAGELEGLLNIAGANAEPDQRFHISAGGIGNYFMRMPPRGVQAIVRTDPTAFGRVGELTVRRPAGQPTSEALTMRAASVLRPPSPFAEVFNTDFDALPGSPLPDWPRTFDPEFP